MIARTVTARLGAAVVALAALAATASPALALSDDATGGADNRPRVYKGRVTAKSGLLLRDSPTRGSRVIRTEPYRAIVHIFCKTSGQAVGGNRLWYQLTDGTWAWGAAKYIDNIGAAPRWC
ncbi:SH3 domain-containing protein [Streptomyces kunmingensis]|uniref:SH3 domain-containing protein n=1 Tax=Streptomyces kunmingensis TaxID=68225 RepID=A0ABU6C4Z2_9ACTN|nr:SH3 domain-containing protein [Streptomyces kunmingensis]MEB3959400.1 SH3 domain-containing protein [Streptomyces kunmingensis]